MSARSRPEIDPHHDEDAGGSSNTVRQLLALARRLRPPGSDGEHRHGAGGAIAAGRPQLERVALLRDELHVIANRVARFEIEQHPIVDPLWIAAPTAASAVLGAEQLIAQLDLAAVRLLSLLEPLSSPDWLRAGLMGDRPVSLRELVDQPLQRARHDLVDLLDPGASLAPHEGAAASDDRALPERRAPELACTSRDAEQLPV